MASYMTHPSPLVSGKREASPPSDLGGLLLVKLVNDEADDAGLDRVGVDAPAGHALVDLRQHGAHNPIRADGQSEDDHGIRVQVRWMARGVSACEV